jgi:hypothetical protein
MADTHNIENEIAAHLTTEAGRKHLTRTIRMMTEMGQKLTYGGIAARADFNRKFIERGAMNQDDTIAADAYRDVKRASLKARTTYNTTQNETGFGSRGEIK